MCLLGLFVIQIFCYSSIRNTILSFTSNSMWHFDVIETNEKKERLRRWMEKKAKLYIKWALRICVDSIFWNVIILLIYLLPVLSSCSGWPFHFGEPRTTNQQQLLLFLFLLIQINDRQRNRFVFVIQKIRDSFEFWIISRKRRKNLSNSMPSHNFEKNQMRWPGYQKREIKKKKQNP